MPKPISVSIIVVNYNTSDILWQTLKSIADTVGEIDVDVVVVDNKSSDGGFSKLDLQYKTDPRFTLIENKVNTGLAAMNIMLSRTVGKYILTLDPDAILHPGALQALVTFLDTHPEAGAATARLLNVDATAQPYYRRTLTPVAYFFMTPIGRFLDKYFLKLSNFNQYHCVDVDPTKISEVQQPSVTCLMIRRSAIQFFIIDPDTPFYFTDVGLCKRIYNSGYKIYLVPSAKATHLKSTSFKKTNTKWRNTEYYRSLGVYFRKYYRPIFPIIWLLMAVDRTIRGIMINTVGREPFR